MLFRIDTSGEQAANFLAAMCLDIMHDTKMNKTTLAKIAKWFPVPKRTAEFMEKILEQKYPSAAPILEMFQAPEPDPDIVLVDNIRMFPDEIYKEVNSVFGKMQEAPEDLKAKLIDKIKITHATWFDPGAMQSNITCKHAVDRELKEDSSAVDLIDMDKQYEIWADLKFITSIRFIVKSGFMSALVKFGNDELKIPFARSKQQAVAAMKAGDKMDILGKFWGDFSQIMACAEIPNSAILTADTYMALIARILKVPVILITSS